MLIANEMENDPTLGAGDEPTGLAEVSEQMRAKAAAKRQQSKQPAATGAAKQSEQPTGPNAGNTAAQPRANAATAPPIILPRAVPIANLPLVPR